jgi:ubiquinone/menaquinone biosynthesis C-methylase UbiE
MSAERISDGQSAAATDGNLKAAHRSMWAAGDYHRFAKATIWELGAVLAGACGIRPGQRVLDVATGSGNTAIRAAMAGAKVTASDLTPENFAAGAREASGQNVSLEWVVADAEDLPFDDNTFDVITSSVGAMFAPNHQAVADELVRVCRAGGTIGMINFTPEGLAGDFFGVLAPYAPPPPAGAASPLLWGSEAYVQSLFGDRVEYQTLERRAYQETADSPRAYCDFFRETFGPVNTLYNALADQPERLAQLDRDFVAFATRANRGTPEGRAAFVFEYLLVVAQKR